MLTRPPIGTNEPICAARTGDDLVDGARHLWMIGIAYVAERRRSIPDDLAGVMGETARHVYGLPSG